MLTAPAAKSYLAGHRLRNCRALMFQNALITIGSLGVIRVLRSIAVSGRWLLLGLLSACSASTPAPQAVLPVVEQRTVEPVAQQPRVVTTQEIISRLLVQAERALASGRLTLPLHDNALDRYNGVLALDPDNEQARSGIQLVGQGYLALSRDAMAHSKLSLARDYLRSAKEILGDNPLVTQLQRQIASSSKPKTIAPVAADDNTFQLAAAALSQRNDVVKQQLAKIAQRVQASGELVLIVARSDAEGRWIYRQMREAVNGYRLRGDIKIGSQPAVTLLPAIE